MVLSRRGHLSIAIDNTMMDPMLVPVLEALGTDLLQVIDPLNHAITPHTISRMYAVRKIPGGRMASIEYEKGALVSLFAADLIKPEILPYYQAQVTAMFRRFTPPTL